MRFWWTKLCAMARPPPSGPSRALSGTHTSVKLTRGWSVGTLKVHRYSSITRPGDGLGTSRQVMRFASPSAPPVRQKVAQWVATRSEERTSELQSLMRISYAVFCLKKKTHTISRRINRIYIQTQQY